MDTFNCPSIMMNNHTQHNNKDKLGNNEQETQLEQEKKKKLEIDGPTGLEPTRYGDWEKKGRCIDF